MVHRARGQAQALARSSAEEAKLASELVARWLNDPEARWQAQTLSRSIADVRADVARFLLQLGLARAAGTAMPCIHRTASETPVPIVVAPAVPEDMSPAEFGRQQGQPLISWYHDLSVHAGRLGPDIELHEPEVAKGFLQSLLKRFLVKRFGAAPVPKGSPGLPIRVETRTKGGRVHVSNAFVRVYDRVFGEPTSPVDGWLGPANYYFGVSKGGRLPKFDDTQLVEVPPPGGPVSPYQLVRLHL
jgi:hypothetical protein